MIGRPRLVEVLAPGGSLEHIAAAIVAGADACYVGLKGLSARPDQWSFNPGELSMATSMLHRAGRRIYVALNAEFHDNQRELVVRAGGLMSEIGVDALIVGDFGLLDLLKTVGNPIPIHASTLLGVYNCQTIRFLFEEFGVRRIVINTNLTAEEIADLHFRCPETEFELIVHGGICFNDNRRCRLAHYIYDDDYCVACKQIYICKLPPGETFALHERSIQEFEEAIIENPRPSRLIWSPELDLSRTARLFLSLGVISFKIEGRTKTTEYVREATSKWRSAIDEAVGSYGPSHADINQFRYLVHDAYLRELR